MRSVSAARKSQVDHGTRRTEADDIPALADMLGLRGHADQYTPIREQGSQP
jgi:hypothetical protein